MKKSKMFSQIIKSSEGTRSGEVCRHQKNGALSLTYLDATGQPSLWKHQLKLKLIFACVYFAFGAEDLFVLKQGSIAVAQESEVRNAIGGNVGIAGGLVGGIRVLVDAYRAAQGDREVCDPDGLDDGQNNGAPNSVACIVFAMRFGGANVEVDNISHVSRADREGKAREEGSRCRLVIKRGGRVIVARRSDHLISDVARGGGPATSRPRRPRAVMLGVLWREWPGA